MVGSLRAAFKNNPKNIDVYLAFTRILKITPFWILTHTLASAMHPKIAVFSYKSINMFAIGEIVVGKRTRKKMMSLSSS